MSAGFGVRAAVAVSSGAEIVGIRRLTQCLNIRCVDCSSIGSVNTCAALVDVDS